MDTNENQAVVETEAQETQSPSVTDGTSSSEVVADAPQETMADALRTEFLKEYGEDDPEETGETDEEEEDAGSADSGDDAESSEADTADDTQKPETEEEPSVETDDADDDKFRIPDKEFKELPQSVKNRVGHLNTRVKKAERELSEVHERMPTLQDSHDRFTKFTSFVTDNNIQNDNVTVAFNAMANLSKGDYQGFIDLVQPWYQQAMQAVGAEISPDLRQRVDDGYLTEDDAKELTKARVQAQTADARATHLTQQSEQRNQQDTRAAETESVIQAIDDREAYFKSSDPDYAHKSRAIASMIELAVKNGAVPKTKEQAIALVNDAHKSVTETMTPARRNNRPTPPRPSASTPPRGVPEPTNTLEAIGAGLRSLPSS